MFLRDTPYVRSACHLRNQVDGRVATDYRPDPSKIDLLQLFRYTVVTAPCKMRRQCAKRHRMNTDTLNLTVPKLAHQRLHLPKDALLPCRSQPPTPGPHLEYQPVPEAIVRAALTAGKKNLGQRCVKYLLRHSLILDTVSVETMSSQFRTTELWYCIAARGSAATDAMSAWKTSGAEPLPSRYAP